MAAVPRVTCQFGTRNGTRSTLVRDREVEEGHSLISQLGFDVETQIKSLLLGRVPPRLGFPHTMLLGCVPCEQRGRGHPSPLLRGHRWRGPSTVSDPTGLTPARNLGLCCIPTAWQGWKRLQHRRGLPERKGDAGGG